MKLLENRILSEGKVFPGDILKIDSFLNHQIDIKLMEEIGKETKRLFPNIKPTKILTIESSGIAIASEVSKNFNYVPIVFAKKRKALNMADAYCAKEKSYTRNDYYDVMVAKDFIHEEDKVLIVDDFLANGEALNALIEICKQANATILGACVAVCKTYQPGLTRIENLGIHVECLAKIKSLDNNIIEIDK